MEDIEDCSLHFQNFADSCRTSFDSEHVERVLFNLLLEIQVLEIKIAFQVQLFFYFVCILNHIEFIFVIMDDEFMAHLEFVLGDIILEVLVSLEQLQVTYVFIDCSVEQFLVSESAVVEGDNVRETFELHFSNAERVKVILVFEIVFHVCDAILEQSQASFELQLV